MNGYKLIIVWDTGEREEHHFITEEDAIYAGRDYKIIFGNQVWTCVVPSR